MTRITASEIAARPARRLSFVLSALCLVLLIAAPAAALLILVFLPEVATQGLDLASSTGEITAPAFTVAQRVVIVLVNLLPVTFVTYALVCARRCFQSFIRGEYFTLPVVKNLRGLAAGIALWTITAWLATPLLSVLLTLGAEEQRLTVNFSQSGLLALLFAGIVWQIADIMTRAVALAEENSQFV